MHREIGTLNFSNNHTKRSVTFVTCLVHEGKKSVGFLRSQVYKNVGALVCHTVYKAVDGTVQPLLGSRRNGQPTLYLF